MKKKLRVERAKPGLKQLTPWEKQLLAEAIADNRRRWELLLAGNVWKPQIDTPLTRQGRRVNNPNRH